MLKTLIIDDEPALQADLKLLLSRYPGIMCIGACGSVAEARVLIAATQPDLVLLDIQLSDGTGFDLLQSLGPIHFRIIFITAYGNFAIKAIRHGALDYLMKPVDEEELEAALKRAMNSTPEQARQQLPVLYEHLQAREIPRRRIALRSLNYLEVVQYDDIVYCRSDAGYTSFFLTGKRKIVSSKTIGEYEQILPGHEFIRCHQSYIVNANFIKRLHKDNLLVLHSGDEIPVSTRKKDAVVRLLTT